MSYPGGKSGAGVYQTLINLMPPHDVYIEPFLGGGAIMRRKHPAPLNIGIDKDKHVIKKWLTNSSFASCDDERSRMNPTLTSDDDGSRFEFRCQDGMAFLSRYAFTGKELVYCDPPYVHSTRRRSDLYRHEMTDRQHSELLRIIRQLPCPVMISGYWSELYADALSDWRSLSFTSQTRGGPRTEWVWYNFRTQALHDYSYLGQNFRERERIKRKRNRWIAKLSRMNPLERQALVAAIAEAWNLKLLTSPSTASVDQAFIVRSNEATRSR